MLFYDSVGPNPRVVRMFAAERGIELPSTKVDLPFVMAMQMARFLLVLFTGPTLARLLSGPIRASVSQPKP